MNDAKYWLDKIKTEKPKWFKITKKMKSLFINGETIDLDGLTIKKAKRSEITTKVEVGDITFLAHRQKIPRNNHSSIIGKKNTIIKKTSNCGGPIPSPKNSDTIFSSSGAVLGKRDAIWATNQVGNKLIVAPPSNAVRYGRFTYLGLYTSCGSPWGLFPLILTT